MLELFTGDNMRKYDKNLDLRQPGFKGKLPLILAMIAIAMFGFFMAFNKFMVPSSTDSGSYHQKNDKDKFDYDFELKDKTSSALSEEGEVEEFYSYYLNENNSLYYGFAIRNLSEDEIYEYPSVKITLKDEDGTVLDTEERYLSKMYPNQVNYISDYFYDIEKPAIIEYKFLGSTVYSAGEQRDFEKEFTISHTKKEVSDYGTMTCTGEVENHTDKKEQVQVFVLLRRNGNLVKIDYTIVEVEADDTEAFEIYDYDIPGFDEVEYQVAPM